MSKGKIFREAMKRGMVAAPGCYDCVGARAIERAGFDAVYMTGAGTAASLGYPDYGIVTMTEMAENAGRIARAIKMPVIADADTGYGNELNVIRTVREYEMRGVAGIHIEDQDFPKKCGHLEGKVIIPLDDYVAKIRAAVSAKTDPDFLIIARTDSRAVLGYEEAIRRANAAIEAGADMAFVEAPQTLEETANVPKLVKGPCLLNMVWRGKTPDLSIAEADEDELRADDPARHAHPHHRRRLRCRARRAEGQGPPSGAVLRHHAAAGLQPERRRRMGPLPHGSSASPPPSRRRSKSRGPSLREARRRVPEGLARSSA